MENSFDPEEIKCLIRDVPNYPQDGIIFKDIAPLLLSPIALQRVCEQLAASNYSATLVAGIEARGFIFGSLVANILGIGFIPLRKPGKLPRETFNVSYELEYGKAELEMHTDALKASDSVLIIDDVLATGGTATAGVQLIEKAGATVSGLGFVIEIKILKGKDKLKQYPLKALVTY